MDTEQRFETVCRLMNRALHHQGDAPVELRLDADEMSELMTALEYYREAVDPSSGDVLIRTEYSCPGCGSSEAFRAQEGQVSMEAEHSDIGVEVFRVHGIAQCSECTLQVELNQFTAAELKGFDADAWEEVYEGQYRGRESVSELPSE